MSSRVFLVAAEESGDRLGAALLAALRKERPGLSASGVGGAHMAAQGVTSLFDTAALAIIGFTEIPAKLPMILARIRETVDAIVAQRPDVLIIIDSPDFSHRVARRVRKAAPHIPIINYAPPSAWAWRPGRARAMRGYIDEVLAILPFEPDAFARLSGPHCTYVGHPLAERVTALRPRPEDARRRLADPPVVLVLPGRRGSEIRRLTAIFGDAIARAAANAGPFDLVLPTLPHIAARVRAATNSWPIRPRIVVDPAEKDAAFRTARAALAASGTVTLELALAQVPMVAAYRIPAWEGWLFRMMTTLTTVNLANLTIGENVVPEYLQTDCRPDRLASGLVMLLGDAPERRRQIEAFGRLDAIMQLSGEPPSQRAARAVLDVLNRTGGAT